jgi:hypothetical protein
MSNTDANILDHLKQLSATNFCPKTPFVHESFLHCLASDSLMASRMLRHNFYCGTDPKPGDLWFPNGTSSILLLDERDFCSVTEDPDVNQDIELTTRECCGLLLAMNDGLSLAVQHCPELANPDQFPLEPILQMLITLEWLEDRGMRHLIVQAIRRVFTGRPQSYAHISPQ